MVSLILYYGCRAVLSINIAMPFVKLEFIARLLPVFDRDLDCFR